MMSRRDMARSAAVFALLGLAVIVVLRNAGAQTLFQPLHLNGSLQSLEVPSASIQITLVDLIYFVAILLGVMAKAVWDYLNERLEGLTPPLRTLLIKIALATIIAVLIYSTAISNVPDSHVLTLAGISLAFQGGFFWQSLFQNLAQSFASQAPS